MPQEYIFVIVGLIVVVWFLASRRGSAKDNKDAVMKVLEHKFERVVLRNHTEKGGTSKRLGIRSAAFWDYQLINLRNHPKYRNRHPNDLDFLGAQVIANEKKPNRLIGVNIRFFDHMKDANEDKEVLDAVKKKYPEIRDGSIKIETHKTAAQGGSYVFSYYVKADSSGKVALSENLIDTLYEVAGTVVAIRSRQGADKIKL